jgi:IS605 OrfB family transposase
MTALMPPETVTAARKRRSPKGRKARSAAASTGTFTVTRVTTSRNLTARKYAHLSTVARNLGRIRQEMWNRYGSTAGYALDPRAIRDALVAEKRDFGVQARLWKETLRDVLDDIRARRDSGFKAVAKQVYRRYGPDVGKVKCQALKDGTWRNDRVVHRYVRHHLPRGHTKVDNQIILDSQCYKFFSHGGKGWIEVTGLIPRKRVAIPLDSTHEISGTIRLILRNNRVEVHHTVKVSGKTGTKLREVGVDKGYTEVYTDSEGARHGVNLGKMLTRESDRLKLKEQRRNVLRSIALKKPHKRANIERNNLGTQKMDRRRKRHVAQVRDEIYQATHVVLREASLVVHEDLSVPMKSRKKLGRNTDRRLSGWVKGIIQIALESVAQRYGVPLRAVNPAYTSQVCSECGALGERRNGQLYCMQVGCGVVTQEDVNAARNVLARSRDEEIHLWMKTIQVKSILLRRSPCQPVGTAQPGLQLRMSTESEIPDLRSNA